MSFAILIIDDDPDIRNFVKYHLEQINTRVFEAEDGAHGLELIAQREFDAILLDIKMPGMDGFEICRRVRQQLKFSHVPILVMSILDEEEFIVEAFQSGANEYVQKPIRRFELIARIEAVVNHRRVERELYQAKIQAERANEIKSDFISHLNHELRNPLTSIMGYAQILENDRNQSLTANQLESVQQIINSANYLLDLTNEILDLARIEAGKVKIEIEPVSCDILLNECIDMVQPLAQQRGIRIDFRPDNIPVMIWANPLRLKQIFLNLLSNAIKYNRDSGTITISLTSLPGAKIRLGIADTGPGIPDHLLEQIFEPFNRLSAEQAGIPGTGIGLTVSRQLVRLMAGQLFVTSKLNEGTTFWMEFNCTAAGKILASSTKI